ncbi:hypothetical protein [Methanosarcina sp.]|uniref:hypothetical protein n=1 Tax=Methanosarcina sp. TaxID=2213 RepID=UPI003C7762B2
MSISLSLAGCRFELLRFQKLLKPLWIEPDDHNIADPDKWEADITESLHHLSRYLVCSLSLARS